MMSVDRLLAIILKLLHHEKLTARELACELGVSERTIYKEMAVINDSNIPVIAEPGPDGGYSLLESFHLNRDFLSLGGLIDLLYDLAALEEEDAELNIAEAMAVIQEAMPEKRGRNLLEKTEFAIEPSGYTSRRLTKLRDFYRAVQEKRIIVLGYHDRQEGFSRYSVEPADLIFKDREWFLSGFIQDTETYEHLALADIGVYELGKKEITSSGDYGRLQEDETPEERQKEAEHMICHLLFSRRAEPRVRKLLPEAAIVEERGDEILVTVRWPNNEWVKRTILSFGSRARVLAPAWLAASIKREAEKIVKKYDLKQED